MLGPRIELLGHSLDHAPFLRANHMLHSIWTYMSLRVFLPTAASCSTVAHLSLPNVAFIEWSHSSVLHTVMATGALLYGNLMTPSMNARSPAACRASKNLYQVLALEPENVDGVEAVKRAYRSMARRHHPDVCPLTGKEEATRLFIEIKKAYDVLSNPVLREKYDHQLGLPDLAADREQEKRRVLFPREVWMEQVQELKGRSRRRAKKKEMGALKNSEIKKKPKKTFFLLNDFDENS
ncbi:hypothetical protein ZIOFF_068996 [Zingiber officinale]|uniref:J domain-containing protein n=1 Tax=Zingiber officinale TaxID=94328 RepID=A0A8J5C399_ZINOF|nr:hypothetical protein ZIOFF_068996 [Zingiber officinale]